MVNWKKKGRNSSDTGYLYTANVGAFGVGKLVYDNGRTEFYTRGVDYRTEAEVVAAAKKATPDLNEVWDELQSGHYALYAITKTRQGSGKKSHWLEDVHGFDGASKRAQNYVNNNTSLVSVEIRDKDSNETVATATKD